MQKFEFLIGKTAKGIVWIGRKKPTLKNGSGFLRELTRVLGIGHVPVRSIDEGCSK
jgi:hypothetical protein